MGSNPTGSTNNVHVTTKAEHLPRATMLLQCLPAIKLASVQTGRSPRKNFVEVRNETNVITGALWHIPKGFVWKGRMLFLYCPFIRLYGDNGVTTR